MTNPTHPKRALATSTTSTWIGVGLLTLAAAGCRTPEGHRQAVDRTVAGIIEQGQLDGLGRTEEFTVLPAADLLRQRLMLSQQLQHNDPASLGSQYLEPIEHWPADSYLDMEQELEPGQLTATTGTLTLTLDDALQVAARNNRAFQAAKEDVFSNALSLDLEREEFRTSFAGLFDAAFEYDRTQNNVPGGEVSGGFTLGALGSVSKRLKNGADMTLRLGWDLARLLEPNEFGSRSVFGDASISIPLMRGAGRHIVTEDLTQAERDVIYAIWEFERFKREFAVDIASQYFEVLQREDEVLNAAENYRGLIASTRRARRLLDAGDLPPIQVDQSIQDELRARNRWVSARESYIGALDSYKILLGLPTDAQVELDRAEFDKLAEVARRVIEAGEDLLAVDEEIPPADAPIELEEPSKVGAGGLEMAPEEAVRIALERRLDLRTVLGGVDDAKRRVVVAADRLRAEVTLGGSASVGEGRSLGSASGPDADDLNDLSLDSGLYTALLSVDLPLERTAEAIAYRQSYLNLEAAVRRVQDLEDRIKLELRNQLRNLREARESLRIQAISVELAQRRVRGADLNLQAGRVEIRDLLEAQEDLLSAQNALTGATVDYRVAELELQRDLGVLEVGPDGLWREWRPEELTDEIEP